ncbi:MgtC/SapB family protein [Ahrensia kielensis]|uniref:MgtC/SapB family protein n=1 Tax=Ahrensia kielensis TaxID=76980 RepID=UPI00036F5CED|nr:MgtC/SapB family protein [Ahrensia kielensis]
MFEQLKSEFSTISDPSILIITVRLIGAAILCGLIGYEREVHKNTAGLRTNMLVGAAAACFAIITLTMLNSPLAGEDVQADPIRLVEAVTNGVAFLAAGIVVFTQGKVKGLTTGASMWISAAIGLAAGLGYWPIALITTLLGVIVLAFLRRVQFAVGMKDKS